jgi:hypothetical protein
VPIVSKEASAAYEARLSYNKDLTPGDQLPHGSEYCNGELPEVTDE